MPTNYSQLDPRWKNLTYDGKHKFSRYGCFVCTLSDIVGTEPPQTALKLAYNGCFDAEGRMYSICAKNALELDFSGSTSSLTTAKQFNEWVIAETLHYGSQHFYLLNTITGEQYDPLGASIIYKIKSFRLFKNKKKEYMTKDQIIKMVYGIIEPMWRRMHSYHELDENGQASIKKEATEMVDNAEQGNEWVGANKAEQWYNEELKGQIEELQNIKITLGEKDATIAELQKELTNINKLYEEEKQNVKVVEKKVVSTVEVDKTSEMSVIELIKIIIERLKWKK